MSPLEKLYISIQNLKELGVKLPQELIEETNRVEEEIIKKDVIPVLENSISPIINQINREVVLVVEYIPNEAVTVKWSRKRNISFPLVSEILPLDRTKAAFAERESYTIAHHSKSSKTLLRVTFTDGKSISHRFAYQTMMDVIRSIGHEKVEQLHLTSCGVPLISSDKDDFYTQHELQKDVYVMTHSSTKTKKEQLDEISRRLNLGLKVEFV